MDAKPSVAIIGVGLIGGSIGLALKKNALAADVVGIGHRRESLDEAETVGAVDRSTTDLAEGVREAELVFVCSPVGMISEHVRLAAEHCREGALLTDAGSTKEQICRELAEPLPRGCRFLGGHPLAGSEKKGARHASADLFRDRLAILTPRDGAPREDLERLQTLWQGMGSQVIAMEPAEHDRILAMTSHLPHAVAVALAATLTEKAYPFTGTGFRDTSRLAAGDPTLWNDIFSANRHHVLHSIDAFADQLARLREAVDRDDPSKLKPLLEEAKNHRDALGS
jgi:prephenate dehydrogenase